MFRGRPLLIVIALLSTPSIAHAQAGEPFLQAVAQLVNADAAGDGPGLVAALEAMESGLAQWDDAVARVEARFAAEIGGATPAAATEMRTAIAFVYLDRWRLDRAIAHLDAAVKTAPTAPQVQLLRGWAYMAANRPAQTVFRAARQLDAPDPVAAYLFLRSMPSLTESAEVTAALRTILSALGRAPGAMEVVPAFAVPHLLDEASLSAPAFLSAAYAPAARLIEQGRYRESLTLLKTAAAADPIVTGRRGPADERALIASADAKYEAGDVAGARDALAAAIAASPESGRAHWKLGRLLAIAGDQDGALRAFERAATIPALGGMALVHAEIGRLRHTRLDLDGAAAAYSRRVRLTPNDSAVHFDLAEVFRAQDKLPAALAEYLAAALVDPTSAKAFAMIGLVHASAGRDADAVEMLRRAVALDPAHAQARYGLSRALMRLGKVEEARGEFEAFEQLQAKAMEDERRRVRDNQITIDATLGR